MLRSMSQAGFNFLSTSWKEYLLQRVSEISDSLESQKEVKTIYTVRLDGAFEEKIRKVDKFRSFPLSKETLKRFLSETEVLRRKWKFISGPQKDQSFEVSKSTILFGESVHHLLDLVENSEGNRIVEWRPRGQLIQYSDTFRFELLELKIEGPDFKNGIAKSTEIVINFYANKISKAKEFEYDLTDNGFVAEKDRVELDVNDFDEEFDPDYDLEIEDQDWSDNWGREWND